MTTRGATGLTRRELTVISLMSAGHTTPKIAIRLGLRPRTIENHKRHIYAKLGVGCQSQAISRALALGLLDAPGHLRLDSEPGRPILVIVSGAGTCCDQVMQSLLADAVPVISVRMRQPLTHDHAVRWHRGALAVVLVDPTPEDWTLPRSLGAPAVVVCSRTPEPSVIVEILAHGAGGLVFRDDIADDLTVMLAFVSRGRFAMSGVYAEALARLAPSPATVAPELTARERDILSSIACGHTIRQTARALGIAAKTVENTQARLFRKLGTRNRAETLAIADGWGLIGRVPAELPADTA